MSRHAVLSGRHGSMRSMGPGVSLRNVHADVSPMFGGPARLGVSHARAASASVSPAAVADVGLLNFTAVAPTSSASSARVQLEVSHTWAASASASPTAVLPPCGGRRAALLRRVGIAVGVVLIVAAGAGVAVLAPWSRAPPQRWCHPAPVGYYCVANASDPVACGAGSYCYPAGAVAPTPCAAGRYGAEDIPLYGSDCAGPCAATLAPGRSCLAGTRAPGGELCAPGNFCVGGPPTRLPRPCDASGYWCPRGSSLPNASACAAGYWGVGVAAVTYASALCAGPCAGPAGTWCPAASDSLLGAPCPLGRWCAGGAAWPELCGVGGFYCGVGAPSPTVSACQPGYFGTAAGASTYSTSACGGACTCSLGNSCPRGSSLASGVACPVGSWCAGNAAQPVACTAAGFFCGGGASTPTGSACAAGRYGTSAGASLYGSALCTGPCAGPAGTYCGPGSTSPEGVPCPLGRWCAGGPSNAVACDVGGYWCPVGSASATGAKCAMGSLGTSAGAGTYDSSGCAGPCMAARDRFCPPASAAPEGSACPVGYACAGGTAPPVLPRIPLTGYLCPTCPSAAHPAALMGAVHAAYSTVVLAFVGWAADGTVKNQYDAPWKGFTLTRGAVAALQANGTRVLLSVGGATNTMPGPPPAGFVARLAAGLASLVQTYSLDGLDFDVEQFSGSAEAAGLGIAAVIAALRAGVGGAALIITAAPQLTDLYPAVRTMPSAPLPYNRLAMLAVPGSGVDVFMVQMYNTLAAGQALSFPPSYASSLAAGFAVAGASTVYSCAVPPSALAFGYPAAPAAAGSGFHAPAEVVAMLRALAFAGTTVAGLMTWSIDHDAVNGWAFARAVAASSGTWAPP